MVADVRGLVGHLGRRVRRGRGGRRHQLAGRRVTPLRVLVHAGPHDQVHGGRDAPVEQRRRRRRVAQLRGQLPDGVDGREGHPAGEALEQHARQGVDVRRRVDRRVRAAPRQAFRRHVVEGAHVVAGVGQLRDVVGERARDAEVGEVGGAVPVEQDVGRLDVAVQHAGRVRGVQCARHLGEDLDRARRGQRPVGQHALEVRPVDEGHVQVRAAVDLAVRVDGHDVRLGKAGDEAGLPPEPREELRLGVPRQALERDVPVVAGVVGAVDLSHATAPEQFFDAVRTEGLRTGHVARSSPMPSCGEDTTRRRPAWPARRR